MGGEHRAGPHQGQGGIEVEVLLGDVLADPLDTQEAGVALVHVEHIRGGGQTLDGGERTDGPHAADTGQQLLLDAVILVAAVEPVGDVTQIVFVFFGDVRVQEQQRNPPDLRHPHSGPQHLGVRHRQLDQHRSAGRIGQQPKRQALRIQRRIVLVLPAVGGQ